MQLLSAKKLFLFWVDFQVNKDFVLSKNIMLEKINGHKLPQ